VIVPLQNVSGTEKVNKIRLRIYQVTEKTIAFEIIENVILKLV